MAANNMRARIAQAPGCIAALRQQFEFGTRIARQG